MIAEHSYYERLLALACARELSYGEALELGEHMDDCLECRRQAGELEALRRRLFLRFTAEARGQKPPAGMSERFIRRAVLSGVPLRNPNCKSSAVRLRQAVVAMTVFTALSIGWTTVVSRNFLNREDAAAELAPAASRVGQAEPLSVQPIQNEAAQTADRTRHLSVRVLSFHRDGGFSSAMLTQKRGNSGVVPSLGSVSTHPSAAGVFHPVLNFRQSFPALDFNSVPRKPEAANHPVFRCSSSLLSVAFLNHEDPSGHNLVRTEFPIIYSSDAWQLR
ncbi:hypothetical protein [Silvibacterium acidisoli]|uniref:hypothetical protein n=1 Tax=Acidobacteriaceae bacterium ZG23-2 TaxID=2883246 RepID=UPI00406D16E6